jgi:hypothetical protein
MIRQRSEIGGIALAKCAVRKTLRRGALVPGLDEVAGNIDAEDVRSPVSPLAMPSCHRRSRDPGP